MSRKRIGKKDSVLIAVRLSGEMAKEFERDCAKTGHTKSEITRKLIEGWLRTNRCLARLRAKSVPSGT